MATPHDITGPVPLGGFIDTLQSGHMPTLDEFVQYLSNMDPLQAIIILAIGLVYMLSGYRLYRILVTANGAFLGFALGHTLGRLATTPHNLPVVTGIAGGLLMGVLTWPLMKVAVSVMAALIGGLVGMLLWRYVFSVAGQEQVVNYSWAGSLLGLISLGMLTFLSLQLTVMIFTSLQGSAMAVSGVLSLLLRYQRFGPQVEDNLANNIHLIPLLIVVPSIVAVVIQDATGTKKSKKKSG